MKKTVLLSLFSLLRLAAYTQEDSSGNSIFQPVEIEAVYKGGSKAWKEYVAANLHYPKKASKHFPAGTEHRVKAKFIVEKDSTISGITVIDDPGYGFGKEIKRLILSSGKWKPAMQNGRIVKAYKTQEFIFRKPDQ